MLHAARGTPVSSQQPHPATKGRSQVRTAVTLATLAALTLSACGSAREGVRLGAYDEFQPVVASTQEHIQLARSANVTVVNVLTPNDQGRPVLFSVQYPRFDTDPAEFTAGSHRLQPRLRTAAAPPRCQPGVNPTLAGCRPHLPDYPGVGVPSLSGYYATAGTLFIASDGAIDPYELADALFNLARSSTELSSALKRDDPQITQIALERALSARAGMPRWAAYYLPAQ
jgi:hypothetical protein